jgi:hypothetical protein
VDRVHGGWVVVVVNVTIDFVKKLGRTISFAKSFVIAQA